MSKPSSASPPSSGSHAMQPPRPRPAPKPKDEELIKQALPDRVRPADLPPRPARKPVPSPQILPSGQPAPDSHLLDHSPLPWHDCFDAQKDIEIPERSGTWRVYTAGMTKHPSVVLVFLHGGGHSALSWALVASRLKSRVPILAFDARGHGASTSADDRDLSAETQGKDAVALITKVFESHEEKPRVVLCGHSMGGAIAVRVAACRELPCVVGLVVIDVVEGTALSALPFMSSWLQARPKSFNSIEKAIRYVSKAGHVRNLESARLSVPPQVTASANGKRWTWRTPLEESVEYWRGWFEGLSALFLSVPAAKMLVLANADRLDKDMMIAHMQGKFQNILISAAGHAVHEDQPDQTSRVLLEYLERNMFLSRSEDAIAGVYQQRKPIAPGC